MINPYGEIQWNNIQRLWSVTHAHGRTNQNLEYLALGGVEHYPMSNYYPSSPVYPLEDYFTSIPEGSIGCPNAEHHNTDIGGYVHINGLGSMFSSGSEKGGEHYGYDGGQWQRLFMDIINNLLYADGGGITINHPCWTHDNMSSFGIRQVIRMLDYDTKQVLGIELYTDSTVSYEEAERQYVYARDMWDEILKTGRRCWGFGTPDWGAYSSEDGSWRGRCILLVPEKTNHAALIAYRNGQFYAKKNNTDLAFTNIDYDSKTRNLIVNTNTATSISVVIDGQYTTYNESDVDITIPKNVVYFRIEAANNDDKIWSNPIMLKNRIKNKSMIQKMLIL